MSATALGGGTFAAARCARTIGRGVDGGAAPDEWTLGPAKPVHELDTVSRYDSKQHAFHFC